MTGKTIYWNDLGVKAETALFAPEGKTAEMHAMLHVETKDMSFCEQYNCILKAEQRLSEAFNGGKIMMRRYFVSDIANQESLMAAESNIPTSIIQQSPLDGSKIAAWVYMVGGEPNYRHRWNLGLNCNEGSSYEQTNKLLTELEQTYAKEDGSSIGSHCIRTWFFVRDIDTQYEGMVDARRENFTEVGLTADTHYLASTGIQGIPAAQKSIIQLDAYSIDDIQPEQQTYLYAKSHLNPTYEYGVTFERGTKVDYADRSHIFISGTASINNKGEVVHKGDIKLQTQRMWENVDALLAEGGANKNDIMQMIVYLRDIADYDTVSQMFATRFPDTPCVITLAPVCRPTWLIEMECIAIVNNSDNGKTQIRDF